MVNELLSLINIHKPSLQEPDKLIWTPDEARGFSGRSFLNQASEKVYQKRFEEEVVNFVWHNKSPPRAELLF